MVAYTLYVIDDEFSITEAIKLALNASYRVVTFSDAGSAIDAIKTDPPDIILLDIGLPDMNGRRRYLYQLPSQLIGSRMTASVSIRTSQAFSNIGRKKRL